MRRPKGAYARNTPDWFNSDLCFAGAQVQASDASHDGFVGLYNDAITGAYLHVVGFAAEIEPTGNHILGFIEQGFAGFIASVATLYAHGRTVRFDRAAPFGTSYSANTPGGNPDPQIILLGGQTNGLLTTPGWPLWIIPPGYSLWFQANHGGAYTQATWWYLVMHD